ncbi:pectinesterase family protein [Asticcacaulis sp. EMRT-3]|uniref:pectinesterase family protein n=1 Tax=Asticcacaulis sp. EMRT-3 TaxID=3040349 RepID=UPI0024AF885D|nr:pectinesterase family protein [Asticcacaulis sp. EMRT-3]MDI7776495.1 pectinesterase family protein [Asticcacaulis sp. EMRT-3]
MSADGRGAYPTVQAAVDALHDTGGEIDLQPGTYREKVTISGDNVHLKGLGAKPDDVVIVWGDSAANTGSTFKSQTVLVTGDGFHADNLTIQNDYSKHSDVGSQAVALSLTGDKDVLTHVRLLGAQDTLYVNKGPDGRMSRDYFADCFIEGHVDFIFGNAKAYFQGCEIHGIAHSEVMYTAQSRNAPDEDSAFVFDHCTFTAGAGAQNVSLGRPWRAYASVVLLNANIKTPLVKGGWREWHPGETDRLKTTYYAEYQSTGPGADPTGREPYSYQLTDAQAARWRLDSFFKGDTDWLPKDAR